VALKKSGTGFVLVEESIKKKRKGRKRQFLFMGIWPRFSARPDLERSLTKTKKILQQSPTLLWYNTHKTPEMLFWN
jgi:hypothetical protein